MRRTRYPASRLVDLTPPEPEPEPYRVCIGVSSADATLFQAWVEPDADEVFEMKDGWTMVFDKTVLAEDYDQLFQIIQSDHLVYSGATTPYDAARMLRVIYAVHRALPASEYPEWDVFSPDALNCEPGEEALLHLVDAMLETLGQYAAAAQAEAFGFPAYVRW